MAEAAVSMRVSREYGDAIDPELLGTADRIESDVYDREISAEERASYAERVVETSARIEDKEEEKKATVKMFSDDIKLLKSARKDDLKVLKRGAVEEVDQLHTFYDHDTLTVHTYNSAGKRVKWRKMKPEERQMKLKP